MCVCKRSTLISAQASGKRANTCECMRALSIARANTRVRGRGCVCVICKGNKGPKEFEAALGRAKWVLFGRRENEKDPQYSRRAGIEPLRSKAYTKGRGFHLKRGPGGLWESKVGIVRAKRDRERYPIRQRDRHAAHRGNAYSKGRGFHLKSGPGGLGESN